MEEVGKLLKLKFIQEVYYPKWLANIVMVKNAKSKLRMSVDYKDLNKVCPKGYFFLLRIDSLGDCMLRHQLLSFMDAFS